MNKDEIKKFRKQITINKLENKPELNLNLDRIILQAYQDLKDNKKMN